MKRERRTVSVFYCIRTYSLLLLLLGLTVRGDDSNSPAITIPIASGTKSLLHSSLFTLSPSLSDDSVIFHLAAATNCSICTPSGLVAGQLEGPTGSPLSRFSMRQLKDDGVYFQHYLEADLDPALFSLFITTPTNPSINQSLVIHVLPFDGIIESLAEPRLLVREDGSVLISAQHLRVGTNFETQTPELTYSVQSIARHGSLELWESDSWIPLSNGSSFTQSQVNALQLRYRQSGPVLTDLLTDSVSLLVSSSQLEGPEVSLIVFIMSSSFSLSPSLSTNTTSLSVQEGGSSLFRKDSLILSFSPSSIESGSLSYPLSHDDFDISLTIQSLPSRGSLILNNGSSNLTLSLQSVINYQDILSQKLIYVHDGSDTTFDSISILVSIASLHSDAFNISESSIDIGVDITPVNDNAPCLKQLRYINPLEGSYVILNESFFKITDPDQIPFDYLIRVDEGSAEDGNGHFAEVNRGLDQKIREFKMSQVINHDIVYVYRELDPAHVLSYNHSVTISDGLHTVKQQLNVSVIPLSISVSTNTNSLCLLTADLLISANPPILSSDHFIIDITLPERMSEVTVSVVKQPLRGYLRESESPTLLTSYSYSSTNNIMYAVNDSLTQETSDIFQLQFSLGHGRSQLVDVGVCIKPRPYLTLMNQTSFTVQAKGEFVITPDNLNVVQTRFNIPSQIRYRLKNSEINPDVLSPFYGEIRDVSTNEKLTEFTQDDINSQKVMYVSFKEHPISTEFDDEIFFEVTNDHYTLSELSITAFVIQNMLNVTRKGFRVTEGGGEHIISKEEFYVEPLEGYETSIYILQHPQFGSLKLKRPSPAPEIVGPRHFNLQDITEGYLVYEYDDKNEEDQDFFYFYFVLRNKNNSDYKDFRGILNINIDLVNDNTPHCVLNKPFVVPEGCEKQITSDHIKCFDSDRPPNPSAIQLVKFHFSHLFGQLCVGDNCYNSTIDNDFSLTWDDILSERFTFKAGNESIPSLATFAIKDELFKSHELLFFGIAIQSTVAHRNVTGLVSVIENSRSFIGSGIISYTTDCSKSITPSDILYSISALPKYGRVLKHGLPIDIANNSYHFTQEDVNSQSLVYEQDGSNVESDFFNVSVQILSFREDDVLISVNTTTIDDDPPTLDVTRVLFVGNGSVADIHKSILSMTDLDTTDPSKLIYHVISSSSGKIELQQQVKHHYLETDSFTQQEINGNLVRYKHDLLTAWSDNIVLRVSDGVNDQPNNYTLRVIIASNTIIETVVDGAGLMEGGNVTVDPTSVTIKHPYFSTAAGTVTILQGVSSGHLEVDGEDCVSNCSFSLDKLRSQNLVYYHDGTETFHDKFVFEIRWDLYHTNKLEYSFNIQPVNDERPHIINNTRFDIYVSKTNPLTACILSSIDSDTPPHLLWYNFNIDVRDRSEGYFAVNGTERDNFTQADIDNGLVSFVDKRKYDGFLVSLNFTVSDGFHVTPGVFKIFTIVVTIRVVSNAPVSVPMGGSVIISTEFLSVDTNQNNKIDSNTISYTLADPKYGIKYGRLSLASSPLTEVTSFNESQVSSGKLLYTHTAVDVWEPAERIALTLYHPLALDVQKIDLIINIDLLTTPNTSLAVKKELRVRENNVICLNQSLIDARNIRYETWKKMNESTSDPPGLHNLSLLFQILRPTSHGSLLLNDSSDFSLTNFTQTELLTGVVCYSNSGSEKHNDSFIIQVQVVNSSGIVIDTSPPETVNIAIELYNDEVPYLNTSLQLTKSFVEGFRSPITRSDLHVIDEDNEPQGIHYFVSNLTSGSLVLGADPNTPVFTFTQADINAGRLVYVPGEVGLAYFNFSFVDEEGANGGQEYKFTLNISSFSFNVKFNDLAILQTHTFGLITTDNLETVTNGNPLSTRFNVTALPSHGEILVSGRASSEFSQLDVDEGRVKYQLFDTSHYKDVMSFDAVNNDIKVSFNISVTVVLDGSANDAVLDLTNASSVLLPRSLFDIRLRNSPDLPEITITSKLQYGYLSRKLPNIGMGSTETTKFNYEELVSNSIYYNFEPTSSITNSTLYEQITGIVTVVDLSPGEFQLTLTLIHNRLSPTASIPSSTQSPTNEPMGTNSPSTGTIEAAFYIPLSALVVLILILFIIIVLFCFCQSRIIKLKLAKGLGGGGDIAKGGFLPPHSSMSYKVADPPYYVTASPHFSSRGGGEGEIDDISDSLSNVSDADVMMVSRPISTSHTHLPYHQDIGYHSHSVDEAIGAGGYMDSMGPPVQRRPLETPPFFSSPHADQYCIDSVPRSRSPLRRPSSLRQNPRPYSSRSSLGRVSPVKPPHFHAPLNFSRPESASSMGYDSSCITEDRHSRPSSVNTSLRVDEVCNSQYEDSTRCTTPAAAPNTNTIALKDQQYWV